jgi:putative membrane protein
MLVVWRGSMIANYTNHAANKRTFLAWIRTGLAVAGFGILLAKLNVFPQDIQERVLANWNYYRYQGG